MDSLTEILIDDYEKASGDENSTRFSEKDCIGMGVIVIEYLKETYSLSDDDVVTVIMNFYGWVMEKHPDIFEFIQELGSI